MSTLALVEVEDARCRSGCGERAASAGRMPSSRVVRFISPEPFHDAPAEIVTEDDSLDKIGSVHLSIGEFKGRYCCRQYHRARMIAATGIVEFEGVRSDSIGERGRPRCGALLPTPDHAMTGLTGRRDHSANASRFLGGCSCQPRPEGIEDVALGLRNNGVRQILETRLCNEGAQALEMGFFGCHLLRSPPIDAAFTARRQHVTNRLSSPIPNRILVYLRPSVSGPIGSWDFSRRPSSAGQMLSLADF